MKIKNSSGFTLIELLVVIAIIGILAALSMVSFTTAQRQARDSQRKSDVKQYSTALEAFANAKNGLYPSRTSAQRASTTLCTDLGLTNCPVDPKYSIDNSYDYKYESNGTGGGAVSPDATKYVLWGKLEGATNYWVVCSSGKSGTAPVSGWSDPVGGVCPV